MSIHLDPYARRYTSLSVKDLLEARDAYHIHLTHIENVFATAIGQYRLQAGDADHTQWHDTKDAAHKNRGKKSEPRTLENSIVRPWSWPCVLVFVRKWLSPAEMAKAGANVVPPFLYMPDGRVIPTCVIQTSLFDGDAPQLHPYTFSTQTVGGGYPIITQVQGEEHRGSVGCLVTDGDQYYALTNQHVAGKPGSRIYTIINGQTRPVGVADENAIRKSNFSDLYPGFSVANTRSNLDVGLIAIDDISEWTAQIFGLGLLGPMVEFDSSAVSLDWISCQVVAHGAHSGRLEGEIKALFYRYRSVGGVDFVSDFLIGGRDSEPMNTMPGDSGTLWCIDPVTFPTKDAPPAAKNKAAKPATKAADTGLTYRPLALQWGGQKLTGNGPGLYTQYALASSVSIACRELDVDIVADLNAELPQYWGAVGHYKIAALAIGYTSGALKTFLKANLNQLTYSDDALSSGHIKPSPSQFVPLADVPDVVWKTNINRGAAAARPQENWNHYADMDLVGADGKTFFDISGTPAESLDLKAWIDFYRTAPHLSGAKNPKTPINMGALPFRVWQIFTALTTFAADQNKFLCAAGILGHYIGDACQPLHGSIHSDGLNGASTGVHSVYEEKMVDKYAPTLAKELGPSSTTGLPAPARTSIASGFEAGLAVIDLMARVHDYLPPEHICEVYSGLGGGQSARVIDGLWDACGAATVQCIADGARTLGAIWQAAWEAAGSPAFAGAVDQSDLETIYKDTEFLKSEHLANLDPADYVPGAPAPPPAPRKAVRAKAVKKTRAKAAHA